MEAARRAPRVACSAAPRGRSGRRGAHPARGRGRADRRRPRAERGPRPRHGWVEGEGEALTDSWEKVRHRFTCQGEKRTGTPMVGRFRAPRSHRRAAGGVRGQGPPDGPVPSPIPGEKAEQQTGCPLSPADPHQRARRPPSRRGGQPATERAPSALPRVARLLRRHAAVHAHEGVDRRVVEPVAERLVHGVEPRQHDRRQRVAVPGEHLRRRHRARRPAAHAEEPPNPGLDDHGTIGARQHDIAPANIVGPQVECPRFARDHLAARAGRRAGDVDGWKEERRYGRGHGSRNRLSSARGGTGRW